MVLHAIIWGMNNKAVDGRSSEMQSHPMDMITMIINLLSSVYCGLSGGTLKLSAHLQLMPRIRMRYTSTVR
jgi:hypothetical protein